MSEIAEEFEERFVDFLNEKYAGMPSWQSPKFHRYDDLPSEFKNLVAMSFFEQQTSNGSLAQTFWNSCPNEGLLLSLCEDGYRMIGANKQLNAIPLVAELFQKWNQEATPYVQREIDGDEDAFGDWCAERYSTNNDLDRLFFLSAADSAYVIRSKWIEQNVDGLNALLSQSQNKWWKFWRQ